MDHEGTREQLELAAVEPGGLERLMAGDTPNAQAVAAHLAGCPSCTDELVRLQRAATLIRGSVRQLPPADLKERTLATIRAEGVRRPLAVAVPAAAGAGATVTTEPVNGVPVMASPSTAATVDPDRRTRRTPPWLGWAGTIAAAVVLSVVTTTAVVNNRVDNQLAAQNAEILALESVTTDTMGVAAEPDAEHVRPGGDGRARLLAVEHRPGGHGDGPDGTARRAGVPLLDRGGWQARAGRQDVLQHAPRLLDRPGRGARRSAGRCEVRCVAGERLGRLRPEGRGARRRALAAGPRLRLVGALHTLVELGGTHVLPGFIVGLRRLGLRRWRVGRWRLEVGAMQLEHPLGRRRRHLEPVVAHHGGQPRGLPRPLDGVDLDLASTGVHDHEPDQPGPDD